MREAFARIGDALKVTFLGGLSIFRFAPIIPLLVMVPEFVQHVYEIQSGMFVSKAAFNAEAMSDTRWLFGYAKIAGLVLAIFAAARFIGGAGTRWWDLRTIAWRAFLIALAVNVAATMLFEVLAGSSAQDLPLAITFVVQIVLLPLLVYLLGPLFGDRTMTLRRSYTVGWLAALLIGLLVMLAFAPAQWVHGTNHTLAMGRPDLIVWALMVWDTLLVGVMACWMGAALAAGYWLGRPPKPGEQRESPNAAFAA